MTAAVLVACVVVASGGAGASPGKALVVAMVSDAITINPFENTVVTPDTQIVHNLYDSLVDFDRDGRVIPALATHWERTSPVTVRLRLRRGVRFHDGREFTADDVKYTFDALRDPAKKYKNSGTHAFIERVDVIDPWTVEIVTKKPEAMAIRRLSRQGIVSAGYTRANPDILNTRPNGTGSYRLVEWVKDDHLTMEAFEGGWRGAPPIERVTWRPVKEDGARVAALLAGEVDVALAVPTDLVPLVERKGSLEVRAVSGLRSYWLMMVNTRSDYPTTKREVRLAVNYAIDRDELNRALFSGRARLLSTALVPGSLGYNPALRWPYDPQRARALLAQAGYPNGLTLGLHASGGRYARDRDMSQALAGQLGRVGITVRVRNLEVGQFTDGIFKKTTDPLVLFAFGDQDRDRTGNLGAGHRSGQLWSVFSYPDLDALITRTERALDDGDRARALHEVQDWMMENAPAAYLLTIVDAYGVKKALDWQPRPDEVLVWREARFER